MQTLGRIGLLMAVVGLLLFLPCGGMQIKGDPDGTWLLIGPVQLIGGAALSVGLALALLSNIASGKGRAAVKEK